MGTFAYDFDAAKKKIAVQTMRLSEIIDASIPDPVLKREFWKLIASRKMLSHEIEASRARIAIEELMAAPHGTLPELAEAYLRFDPEAGGPTRQVQQMPGADA
jgi:hypothetical protein